VLQRQGRQSFTTARMPVCAVRPFLEDDLTLRLHRQWIGCSSRFEATPLSGGKAVPKRQHYCDVSPVVHSYPDKPGLRRLQQFFRCYTRISWRVFRQTFGLCYAFFAHALRYSGKCPNIEKSYYTSLLLYSNTLLLFCKTCCNMVP
jgi:hypothetical protein